MVFPYCIEKLNVLKSIVVPPMVIGVVGADDEITVGADETDNPLMRNCKAEQYIPLMWSSFLSSYSTLVIDLPVGHSRS